VFIIFNKDFTCNNFQYEEGKEFKHDGEIKICEQGFHFCENPLDVLNYYSLTDSIFAEVESLGEIQKEKENNADSKIVNNHIKIVKKLALSDFINAGVAYLLTICKSGDSSKNASSGDSSQNASSGYNSKNASSGDYSKNASSGDYSKNASSGDSSQNASSGNYSKNASSGDYSSIEMVGENNVGANIGRDGIIKGVKGCWITLAEYDKDGICICVKSAQIDGEIIKENTWYKLLNGEFVVVKTEGNS